MTDATDQDKRDALRAQRDAVDRELAAMLLPDVDKLAGLLGSAGMGSLMEAITAAAEPLDPLIRKNVEVMTKLHSGLVTVIDREKARMEKLVAADGD